MVYPKSQTRQFCPNPLRKCTIKRITGRGRLTYPTANDPMEPENSPVRRPCSEYQPDVGHWGSMSVCRGVIKWKHVGVFETGVLF